jgi:hypothetical protein
VLSVKIGHFLSLVTAASGALALGGCASLAVWSAPDKAPAARSSTQARAANDRFWQTLHGGRYDDLPPLLDELTAAYLQNPNDAETAAHIGFAHVWRVSESARLSHRSPTVTDDIVLSHKYFSEAVRLAPKDARFLGFLGGMELAEGSVHGDEKLKRRGYFTLIDAKDAWPEFNLFTMGYTLSRLPYTDDKYRDAVEYQWQTLDLCAEQPVDRKTAVFAPYMSKETQRGPKRVCWNSWIAPHNFEGFFLNMGDMLVKQGDPATARRVYADAKLSKTYSSWPYRDVLEERITQAADNVVVFRKPPANAEPRRTMMIHSAFACMGCHQASVSEH